MPVADLLVRLVPEWEAATRHRFLSGVEDGSLPSAAFDAWLVQDAHFVADLLRFQARLLSRAPRAAQAVLARGALALVDELDWFEDQAAARGLTAGPRSGATETYAALLRRLDVVDPAHALAALWILERVYLDAWSSAMPGATDYQAFVAHWTTPEFAGYVSELESAADQVLGSQEPPAALVALAADVLAAEVAFWDMAVEGA